jgi:integrase
MKRSPYWYYVFKLSGRKQVAGSTRTTDKKLALQIYFAKRSQHQKVQHGFDHLRLKLATLIQSYLDLHSKHTKASYRDDVQRLREIDKFFGNVYVHAVTPDRLEEFRLDLLARGVTKTTVNRYMSVLKHVFTKGIEWGKCSENPVKKVKFYNEKESWRVRFLEKYEKTALLAACPLATRRLIFFALQTGMRQGEIQALRWKEVDFSTNLIHVRRSKGGRQRFIPMNNELSHMLKSISSVSEYVFGKPKSGAAWSLYRKSFEKGVREAGITHFRFHDLRHCFASDLVMKGVGLKTVSELLGHATTQMTERYAHLSPEHNRTAVELLPRGLFLDEKYYTGTRLPETPVLENQETTQEIA